MKRINKKGMLLENFIIGLVIFSIVMTFGFMIYSSNSHNYKDIIENNDSSKIGRLSNKLNQLYGTTEQIKEDTVDSAITADDIDEQGADTTNALRIVWTSSDVAKNMSGVIVEELAFGGNDGEEETSKFLGMMSASFTLILSILILFAIIAIIMRFKAQS